VTYQRLSDNVEASPEDLNQVKVEDLELSHSDSVTLPKNTVEGLPEYSDITFTPIIGAIIPEFGSPRMMTNTGGILEGMRIALDVFENENRQFSKPKLVVIPGGDDIQGITEAIQNFTEVQVLGIVAPLQDRIMLEMSLKKDLSLPVISPISSSFDSNSRSFISLVGVDPGASRMLARQAVTSGLKTVAILHSRDLKSTFEAEIFRAEFMELGGSILGKFEYPVGATFFEEELRAVEELQPDMLFLPVPGEDVELLAPQVTFFGLDSLGIRVFGTAGWIQEDILNAVDTRHTDGVVAASPYPVGQLLPGYSQFLSAYEEAHQRTLPNEMPTLGYDAASLLLEGIRRGAKAGDELLETLDMISDLPGATGIISVEEGRVMRKHFVTCLQNRKKTQIAPAEQSQPILMPPLPDPETDSIPEDAPDRIMGFRCSDSKL